MQRQDRFCVQESAEKLEAIHVLGSLGSSTSEHLKATQTLPKCLMQADPSGFMLPNVSMFKVL